MKKFRITALIMVLVLLLTACGGGNSEEEKGGEQTESVFNNNHIFREEEIELGEGMEHLMQFKILGNTLYTDEVEYSETGIVEARTINGVTDEVAEAEEETATEETEIQEETAQEESAEKGIGQPTGTRTITSFDLEGNKLNEVVIQLPAGGGSGTMTADEQGNIYSSCNYYGQKEDGSEDYRIYLQGHSAAGEELFSLWLNEKQTEDYYYINSLHYGEEGILVVETGTAVEVYDTQGTPINRTEKDGMEGESRLVKIKDGKFALLGMDGDKSYYQTLDIRTGKKGEKQELPFIFYAYNITDGGAYDVYLSDDKGIFGYNLGDQAPTPIMDFLGSDFASYGLNQLYFVDEDSFIALYYHEEGTTLSRFTRVPANEVVEKTELVLGCYYLDSEIKSEIIRFNKESDAYRIRVLDYSDYNTAEDYSIGRTRLNSDIASGNIPDIVMLHNGMPVESYMAKGVFADYYELMEADADFNREDFLPNLFEAYEMNGKLYQMVPCFYIQTFVGKTADVGEDFSWTMEEALALQKSRPEGTKLFPDLIQNDFLNTCLSVNSDEYVNWETGECFFDSDKFIQILDYAKTLPKEYNFADYEDEEAYQEMEMQYREGRSLLMSGVMMSFDEYGSWKYARFGEEITLVGFPTEKGIGSSFIYGYNLAISEQSEHKQAAWEFVKSLLSEEYQDQLEFCFPTRISSLEKLGEKAQEMPFYLDENGEKVEYEPSYYVGNMEVKGAPLTEAEVETIMELIKSIQRTGTYNEEIFNIVAEEAAAFFAGQKSAKEVADIIQSRVRIYVNENR